MTTIRSLLLMLATLCFFGGEAHAIYDAGTGRWLQRDPVGYHDGMNMYQYVGSKSTRYVDPFGLTLTIVGDQAYRDGVESALQEICPAAQVDGTGNVTVNSCGPPPPGNETGCDCLADLVNSSFNNTVANDRPGRRPHSVPQSRPNDEYQIPSGGVGPPLPGAGSGGDVHWDPNTTFSPDPPNMVGPRTRIPDSVILAHELCGHVDSYNKGMHAPRVSVPPGVMPPSEVFPQYVENQIRNEMGIPPRGPDVYDY